MKSKFWVILSFFIPYIINAQIWEPINFPDTLVPKAINAEREGILFVATGGNNLFTGLFRSYDEGTTWEFLTVDTNFTYINYHSIKYDKNDILFVSTASGIFRSFDDGDNFERIYYSSANVNKLVVSPSNEIYALGFIGLIRSSDGGNSWNTLIIPGIEVNDIDFGMNGELYVAGGTFTPWGGGFYRSYDDGETWENVGLTECHLQSVKINTEGILIVGGWSVNYVYSSNDQGTTWEQQAQISADVMELNMGDKLIAGRNINGGAGCWFSEDWGINWISLVDTVLNPHVHQISVAPDFTVYIQSTQSALISNQIFRSINPILGTNEQKEEKTISIFPNPASDVVRISGIADQYAIYNLSGQLLWRGKVEGSIDVTDFLPGVYIIQVDEVMKKLVIE